MRDGRLRRFIGGLGLGYLQMFVTVAVGLWLTPYLLRHLGSHDYGLWLLGAQVLVYLALMDLGVVQLVPREIAIAAGRANGDHAELQALVGQTARLVLWQLLPVAVAGCLIVWLIPVEWAPLRWPMAIVVLTFVVTFPLRVFGAVLQGVQDLAFLGGVQLASWAAGAAMTVAGIAAGLGLYSLALGWVTTQLMSAILAWRRLATVYAYVLPAHLPSLSFSVARHQIGRGAWISVNQVAQVLLGGTDLVVVGKLLGPEAVVPYACTGKLLTMLANQPQMFMQMALPALSEMRTAASRERLFDVSRSMAQVMLLLSGAIVVVVLAVNGPFVSWWVGESRFGGMGLTALLLVSMLVRHVNLTLVYTLFCFGHERRLAVTSVADGLVGLAVMVILVPLLGLYGAVLGSLLSSCLVSVPANLRALAREEGGSRAAFLRPLGPWLARFVAMVAGISVLMSFWTVRGVWAFVPLAAAVGAAYMAVMLPVLKTPPLGPMLAERFAPWISRIPRLARHLPKPAGALAR
ncbi:MAG TPA: oligosaccharide flippase family protein [Vicinamibacterales bacterium]|nr:oligosaccharide flippase family protein [Vicinamibacterales bacterium]